MRKALVTIASLAILLGVILAAAYALSIFVQNVAGYGQVKWTDQLTITESKLDGADTIKVRLQSNVNTVADRVYTVHLFLNGEEVATQTVSWTAPQIPGNNKTKTFGGLDLSGVTSWDIEATH